MKKRAIALMMAAAMVVGVTACGGSDNNTTTPAAESNETTDDAAATDDSAATDAGTETEAPAATTEGGGKILSVQIGPNPETIDPALNSAVDGGNMILHTFECLLTVAEDAPLPLARRKAGRLLRTVLHGLSI